MIPLQVAPESLRWVVGCIVAEGANLADPSLVKAFTEKDYKQFTFPAVANAVCTEFPYRTQLSIFLGIYRVYPQLGYYVKVIT